MHETDQNIPERLPLLDAYLHEQTGGGKPLSGVTVVFIQHQLGSVVPMTRAFLSLGIEPQRVYWVDIPYTANVTVRNALRGMGIPAENFSRSSYHLGKAYAPYQRRRVQELFSKLIKTLASDDRLLVLDDGSYFLEAISCYANTWPRMSIVEQTTRGIIKISKDPTLRYYCSRIPIINVAQSSPKKKWESPFIGEAVCKALLGRLVGRMKLGRKDNCLILGYGAIGRSVVESLRECFGLQPASIYITDPQKSSQRKAASEGYSIWDRDTASHVRFKLVIGCSGTTSFTIGDRVFLEDGAFLASASSGSAELSREEFIDLADTIADDDIYVKDRKSLSSRPIHSDIVLRLVDRDVHFLNGGFLINFTGQVNCVPPKYIQATHTLQVGAALQAINASSRGLINLDKELCDWVNTNFKRVMKANGM